MEKEMLGWYLCALSPPPPPITVPSISVGSWRGHSQLEIRYEQVGSCKEVSGRVHPIAPPLLPSLFTLFQQSSTPSFSSAPYMTMLPLSFSPHPLSDIFPSFSSSNPLLSPPPLLWQYFLPPLWLPFGLLELLLLREFPCQCQAPWQLLPQQQGPPAVSRVLGGRSINGRAPWRCHIGGRATESQSSHQELQHWWQGQGSCGVGGRVPSAPGSYHIGCSSK